MVYQDLEKNTLPLASLFIFTYNQENIISKTINSLLEQITTFHYEIIIAEDCSKDDTLNVCIEYFKKYPDIIRVIHNEQNKGIIKNFHESISDYARGKYIACVAGDDWWHVKDKIQKQVDFLEAHQNYDMVFSDTLIYSQSCNKYLKYRPIEDSADFSQLIIKNCIPALTTCYTKKIFDAYVKDVDPVKVNFPGEDYPMWIWVAYHSKIHHIKEPLTTYRLQNETLSHSSSKTKRVQFEIDRLDIKLFFYNHFGIDNPAILHDIYLMFYFLTLNTASEAHDIQIEKDRDTFFKGNKYYLLFFLSISNRLLAKYKVTSRILQFILAAMMKFRIIDLYYKVYRQSHYDKNRK